jgi:hypothetical protein
MRGNELTFDWQETFGKALEAFPDPPGPGLENQLRDVFLGHPRAVANAITKIVAAYEGGGIYSPWGALKSEITQQIEREARVSGVREATGSTARAEQWIRNAGVHFDRWEEVEDELFGERGILRDHKGDIVLRTRLLNFWQQHRPIGEQVEREQIERAEAWKVSSEVLRNLPRVEVRDEAWRERVERLKKGAVS